MIVLIVGSFVVALVGLGLGLPLGDGVGIAVGRVVGEFVGNAVSIPFVDGVGATVHFT